MREFNEEFPKLEVMGTGSHEHYKLSYQDDQFDICMPVLCGVSNVCIDARDFFDDGTGGDRVLPQYGVFEPLEKQGVLTDDHRKELLKRILLALNSAGSNWEISGPVPLRRRIGSPEKRFGTQQ